MRFQGALQCPECALHFDWGAPALEVSEGCDELERKTLGLHPLGKPLNHIPIFFQYRQTTILFTTTTYWPNSEIQPYFKTTQYSHVAEININSCCCVNIIPPEMLCVLNITAQWTSTISWDSLNILQRKLEEGLNLQSSYRPWSEGDNVLGSVHPSVCPSICGHSHGWTVWPTIYNQSAYGDNCADAVDRLLIDHMWQLWCLTPRYRVRTPVGKPPQYKVCSLPLPSFWKQRFNSLNP